LVTVNRQFIGIDLSSNVVADRWDLFRPSPEVLSIEVLNLLGEFRQLLPELRVFLAQVGHNESSGEVQTTFKLVKFIGRHQRTQITVDRVYRSPNWIISLTRWFPGRRALHLSDVDPIKQHR
jgi:hypothetical protein